LTLKLVRVQPFCGQRINGQEIKRYSVPFPADMILGAGQTFRSAEASVDVTWNPEKTVLEQAVLVFSAHASRGFLSVRAMEARLYVNEFLVIARGWEGWEAACTTKTGQTNIGAYLVNGTNKFRLELSSSWELPSAGIDGITVSFEAWYTGEPPTVKPTTPEWLNYVKWGAIGLGILGLVYVGIRAYEARKKG